MQQLPYASSFRATPTPPGLKRSSWQVIRPEEAGSGFSEVGALSDAKDALREVVQLPLQYPELFASASLARHSKGVLLFGPPGEALLRFARYGCSHHV